MNCDVLDIIPLALAIISVASAQPVVTVFAAKKVKEDKERV
jgi:hypothetical protein